jgi:hypothetical protein
MVPAAVGADPVEWGSSPKRPDVLPDHALPSEADEIASNF